MNALLKNWHLCLLSYVAAAVVAGPIYLPNMDYAIPFYSAQSFIVLVTAGMTLMFLGLDRLMDDLEGPRVLRLVGERVHQS